MRYINKGNISLALILSCTFGYAASGSSSTLGAWVLHNIFIIGAVLVILAGLFAILKLAIDLLVAGERKKLKELGVEVDDDQKADSPSFFKSAYDKAWSLVPMGQEESIDLGHNYDGIRELDNRLPPWWVYLFYGCIAFAGIYMYIYHFSDRDWSSRNDYAIAMVAADEAKSAHLAKLANAVDETSVERLVDAEILAQGKEIFISKCATCHGTQGQGLVGQGPNFADEYWIHGGGIKNIFTTIKYGVPDKGMIAWKAQLNPIKMQQVASYIMSLEGTDPPDALEPQGELYKPEAEESE